MMLANGPHNAATLDTLWAVLDSKHRAMPPAGLRRSGAAGAQAGTCGEARHTIPTTVPSSAPIHFPRSHARVHTHRHQPRPEFTPGAVYSTVHCSGNNYWQPAAYERRRMGRVQEVAPPQLPGTEMAQRYKTNARRQRSEHKQAQRQTTLAQGRHGARCPPAG